MKNNSQNLLSVDCRPTVGRLFADCWPTVSQLLVDSWPTVGRLSAHSWATVCVRFEAKVLADCRPTVCRQSATCWQPVGNVSVTCPVSAGQTKMIVNTCLLLLNYIKKVKVIS